MSLRGEASLQGPLAAGKARSWLAKLPSPTASTPGQMRDGMLICISLSLSLSLYIYIYIYMLDYTIVQYSII